MINEGLAILYIFVAIVGTIFFFEVYLNDQMESLTIESRKPLLEEPKIITMEDTDMIRRNTYSPNSPNSPSSVSNDEYLKFMKGGTVNGVVHEGIFDDDEVWRREFSPLGWSVV